MYNMDIHKCNLIHNPNVLCFWQETLENVKKCKNFLSTLIKLASSGKQSTETAASVRELVKELLVSEPYIQEIHMNLVTVDVIRLLTNECSKIQSFEVKKKKNPSWPLKVENL